MLLNILSFAILILNTEFVVYFNMFINLTVSYSDIHLKNAWFDHYNDVIMGVMAFQITSLAIVYSTFIFRRRSKKTSKLRVTGLCAGNSPVTGEFPAQMASNAENVSIRWHHHDFDCIHFIWADIDTVVGGHDLPYYECFKPPWTGCALLWVLNMRPSAR